MLSSSHISLNILPSHFSLKLHAYNRSYALHALLLVAAVSHGHTEEEEWDDLFHLTPLLRGLGEGAVIGETEQ